MAPFRLGRVEVGWPPDPSSCQVQKTQAPSRVWVIAGGHAAPALEPDKAPCHGVARRVPFRIVGPGVRAPLPGRNDGLDALPRAAGVAVIGRVGDQAGPVPASPRARAWVQSCRPSRAGAGAGRGEPLGGGSGGQSMKAAPLDIGHRGPSSEATGQGRDSREDNGGRAGDPMHGHAA